MSASLCRPEVALLSGGTQINVNDAVLYMNIRFDEGEIVFGTFQKRWIREERVPLLFEKGQKFELIIR